MELLAESSLRVRAKTKCTPVIENVLKSYFNDLKISDKINWDSITISREHDGQLYISYTLKK